jgi:hypothetical protein
VSKKKNEVRPGPTVGSGSPKDDAVPSIEAHRALSAPHQRRGRVLSAQRERPSSSANPASSRRGKNPDRNVRKSSSS